MTSEMFKEYMKQIKENEKLRLSTNDRQKRWAEYMNKINKKGYRSETSFDMNIFT